MRRRLLRRAFRELDEDGDGYLVCAELRRRFNGTSDPRVSSGELTESQVFAEQLQHMHTIAARSGDAFRLSFEEFEEFCASRFGQLSDDAFCTLVSRQWGGVPFVSSVVLERMERRIVDTLFARGKERDVLTRAFRKYDLDGDGRLDVDEFDALCSELCVGATPEEVRALREKYDKDESGTIEFHEFSSAMLSKT
ncbi:hypothetical protein AB1Y20_014229 [Prymnesium parvum]|uniref:EF-hand domain-containing protein n=1 Tax=Prymnesium parvum TaxID=97485 RepID=A0AB34IGH3_PRYPA